METMMTAHQYRIKQEFENPLERHPEIKVMRRIISDLTIYEEYCEDVRLLANIKQAIESFKQRVEDRKSQIVESIVKRSDLLEMCKLKLSCIESALMNVPGVCLFCGNKKELIFTKGGPRHCEICGQYKIFPESIIDECMENLKEMREKCLK